MDIFRRIAVARSIWHVLSPHGHGDALRHSDEQCYQYVDGYCVGNEGLGIRYQKGLLETRMNGLRNLTDRPVTTSEPIDSYLNGPYVKWLRKNSDWLFPLAHPFWAQINKPQDAVDWVENGEAYAVLFFPADFTRNLQAGLANSSPPGWR